MKVLLASAAVLTALTLMSQPGGAGDSGVVRLGHGTGEVGEIVTVVVEAVDVVSPGLGSWSVDVAYDNAALDAVGCTPAEDTVCSEAFTQESVRATGGSEIGQTGTFTIATFSFICYAAGTSELELSASVLATSEPLQDVDMPLEHGSITCTEPELREATATMLPTLPSVGNQSESSSGRLWLVVSLALTGLVLLAGTVAFRRYASPR